MTNEMLYQLQKPYSFLLHVTYPTGGLAYDEYFFRNIVEDDLEEVKAHDTVYRGYGSAYIADCVLDKYIRDWLGSDAIYQAEVNIDDEGGYIIKLTSGKEILQVSDQPDSWLVSVDVVNGPEE